MLSIKDIARLAGVSPATVSRVVNQKRNHTIYLMPRRAIHVLGPYPENMTGSLGNNSTS
jgi:hypothetical protein